MSTTSGPVVDPLPPQRPLERHAHMETDVFCEGCGYNLHGQPVHRDEQLGLMICRCPECGRFHPAGHKTAATSLWLSRVAAIALFFWVLIVLGTIFLAVIGLGGVQMLHIEGTTFLSLVSDDGREVAYEQIGTGGYAQVYAGTTQPVKGGRMHYVRTFTPPYELRKSDYQRPWWFPLVVLIFAACAGVTSGMLLVVFLWHWRKRNYLWMLLIPLLTAGFLAASIRFDDMYDAIRWWGIQRVFFWGAVEAAFMLIGIQIGRPFARLLLRMFVPPKPRQHLAFLWQVDGKTPPPATHSTQV